MKIICIRFVLLTMFANIFTNMFICHIPENFLSLWSSVDTELADKEEFVCSTCSRIYKTKRNLTRHLNYECGKQPQFSCPLCSYRAKHKAHLQKHILFKHSS